jgi:hypothetical protein
VANPWRPIRFDAGCWSPDAELQVEHELVVLVSLGDGFALPLACGPIAGVLHPHHLGVPPRCTRTMASLSPAALAPPPARPLLRNAARVAPIQTSAPAKSDLFKVSLSSPAPEVLLRHDTELARPFAVCPAELCATERRRRQEEDRIGTVWG